jgi:hypothetical protein
LFFVSDCPQIKASTKTPFASAAGGRGKTKTKLKILFKLLASWSFVVLIFIKQHNCSAEEKSRCNWNKTTPTKAELKSTELLATFKINMNQPVNENDVSKTINHAGNENDNERSDKPTETTQSDYNMMETEIQNETTDNNETTNNNRLTRDESGGTNLGCQLVSEISNSGGSCADQLVHEGTRDPLPEADDGRAGGEKATDAEQREQEGRAGMLSNSATGACSAELETDRSRGALITPPPGAGSGELRSADLDNSRRENSTGLQDLSGGGNRSALRGGRGGRGNARGSRVMFSTGESEPPMESEASEGTETDGLNLAGTEGVANGPTRAPRGQEEKDGGAVLASEGGMVGERTAETALAARSQQALDMSMEAGARSYDEALNRKREHLKKTQPRTFKAIEALESPARSATYAQLDDGVCGDNSDQEMEKAEQQAYQRVQNSRRKSRREAGRNGPEIIGDGILSVNKAYQVLKAAVSDETVEGVSSATHIRLMSSANKQRRLDLKGVGAEEDREGTGG